MNDESIEAGCTNTVPDYAALVNPVIEPGELQAALDTTRTVSKSSDPKMRSVTIVANKCPRSHGLRCKRGDVALHFVVTGQRTSKEQVVIIMSADLEDLRTGSAPARSCQTLSTREGSTAADRNPLRHLQFLRRGYRRCF